MKYFILLLLCCFSPAIISQNLTDTQKTGNDYFYANFDDGTTQGFTLVNGSETNTWSVGVAASYQSPFGLYVSSNFGLSFEYNANVSSVVHAYKDIDFSSGSDDVLLTFKLFVGGEDADNFNLHLVSPSVNPVAGMSLNTGQIGKTRYSESEYFRGYKVQIDRTEITEPTMRLVLTWENDNSGGNGVPAAIDEFRVSPFSPTKGWSNGLSLSSRYYAGSIGSGYSLFLAGGDVTGGGVPTDEVIEYDPIGNRTINLPNMPNAVRLNTLVKYSGSLISIGGFYQGNTEPTDEIYAMGFDDFQWNLAATYPKKIFYARASVYDWKYLYIAGGSDETDNLVNDVNYWDETTSSFQPATSMPGDGRADGGFAINEEWGVYIGGFTNTFDFPVQVDSVLIARFDPNNPANITWSTGTNFPGGPRARFNVYPWGTGKFIVVGGTDDGNFSTATIFNDAWVYDAINDLWSPLPNKTIPVCAYQGGIINLPGNRRMLIINGGITNGPSLIGSTEIYSDTVSITSVQNDLDITQPDNFYLYQNYPNPFNPSTKISWQSPEAGWQSLRIYDVLGNEVATLVDEYKPAGSYEVSFDGTNLSSGIYFYRLITNSYTETRKMMLLK